MISICFNAAMLICPSCGSNLLTSRELYQFLPGQGWRHWLQQCRISCRSGPLRKQCWGGSTKAEGHWFMPARNLVPLHFLYPMLILCRHHVMLLLEQALFSLVALLVLMPAAFSYSNGDNLSLDACAVGPLSLFCAAHTTWQGTYVFLPYLTYSLASYCTCAWDDACIITLHFLSFLSQLIPFPPGSLQMWAFSLFYFCFMDLGFFKLYSFFSKQLLVSGEMVTSEALSQSMCSWLKLICILQSNWLQDAVGLIYHFLALLYWDDLLHVKFSLLVTSYLNCKTRFEKTTLFFPPVILKLPTFPI